MESFIRRTDFTLKIPRRYGIADGLRIAWIPFLGIYSLCTDEALALKQLYTLIDMINRIGSGRRSRINRMGRNGMRFQRGQILSQFR